MAVLTSRPDLFTISLESTVLTESFKKLREPLAYALLAATAIYVVTYIVQLLKSRDGIAFSDRSFALQDALTNPVWALVVLAAVALVVVDRPSAHARTIAMVALGLLGLMLLVGLVSWLASYGSDFTEIENFTGKTAHTFLSLARLLVLGAAAALAYTLWKALPAPQRQPQQFQQQWGQQPGQQQWGQPAQPGQYGPPAQPGQPGQYGAPAQAQGQWAAPATGGWGQPPVSAQPQQSWGQQDPYAAPPAGGQPPAGYAAGSEHGAYAAPPEQAQSGWGQPAPEQSGWDRPAGASTDAESTRVHESTSDADDAESPEQRQARENEQRPGWWSPGS
jgi:type II secretory pathway pseudopilin PulG